MVLLPTAVVNSYSRSMDMDGADNAFDIRIGLPLKIRMSTVIMLREHLVTICISGYLHCSFSLRNFSGFLVWNVDGNRLKRSFTGRRGF